MNRRKGFLHSLTFRHPESLRDAPGQPTVSWAVSILRSEKPGKDVQSVFNCLLIIYHRQLEECFMYPLFFNTNVSITEKVNVIICMAKGNHPPIAVSDTLNNAHHKFINA